MARKAQRSKLLGPGRRPHGDVKPTTLDPGQSVGYNSQPSGKSLEEVQERLSKLSQTLEQSISQKRKLQKVSMERRCCLKGWG